MRYSLDLLDELPPERLIAYKIKTKDIKPININVYPLSIDKLNK
jgi:hypothetical protein